MPPAEGFRAPGMLLIGSACRHAGKTLLACSVLAAVSRIGPVNAFKVTMLHEGEPVCIADLAGCPGCAAHPDAFCLAAETSREGNKDTQRLLAAGAKQVLWLRARPDHLRQGAAALLAALGREIPSVGESNSLRLCVEPDLFLMVRRPGAAMKASASAVIEHADHIIDSNGRSFALDLGRLRLTDRGWSLPSASPPLSPAPEESG